MNPGPTTYTATQIARALGCDRSNLLKALAQVPADGCRVVSGNTAKAWSFAALPVRLQAALEAVAQRLCLRNVESLLADPEGASKWAPPIPLEKIGPDYVAAAIRLQSALTPGWMTPP